MNIVACKECGTLYDKDILEFPLNIYDNDYSVDETKASWNGDEFVPFVRCLACGGEILNE